MKTLFVLLFVSLSFFSKAQLKGQWMLGGSAQYSHSKTNYSTIAFNQDTKQTTYAGLPLAGYFFIDRLAAGVLVSAAAANSKQVAVSINPVMLLNSQSETRVSGYGAGPFVRYYLLKPAKKLNVFAEASYIYTSEKSKSKTYQVMQPYGQLPLITASQTESNYKQNSYSFSAGPSLFLGTKVAFELELGYTYSKVSKVDQKVNQFSVGTGFIVLLGK
jgi:hypothetical protein